MLKSFLLEEGERKISKIEHPELSVVFRSAGDDVSTKEAFTWKECVMCGCETMIPINSCGLCFSCWSRGCR